MSEQNPMKLEDTSNVESVEKYKFEPIKGYPMLNWHGKRPFTSTQYYPAQKKEVYGEEVNGWINKIFWGDNLQVMGHLLKEYRGKVDLIYIDPPFDSKAEYKKTIKVRGKSVTNEHNSFEEKQYTDLWNADEYLQFIYERVILLRELLNENGIIFVHCDWHQNHGVRFILDEVFGSQNCHNAISWKRSHAQGNSGQGAKHFGRVTDTILVYSKTGNPTWNAQYIPYDEKTIQRDYKYIDKTTGERYRLMPVDGPGGAAKGNPYYEFLGVMGYWRYSKETMQKLYDNGEIVVSSSGKSLSRKRFLKDAKGTPPTDWWDDVTRISPTSNERLNYPTQKPEALIERIISTGSNVGDLVFDCFMGSGTTQSVAMKLGRRFIGADINLGAIQTTTKRLIELSAELKQVALGLDVKYTDFEVYNVNNYDVFRNPVEAKSLLLEALEVEPTSGTVYDGVKDGYQVKVMPVNRIATREDLNELIANFPYKMFEQNKIDSPNKSVESIMLICMGHEPDLKAHLEQESGYKLNVEVVDILRDKANIQFKRDSEAQLSIVNDKLEIINFFPMNLMQKLSLQKESVSDWKELVEEIKIDWNYDGAVLEPTVIDIPEKEEFVHGIYDIPSDAGAIKIKITDLLSESYEEVIQYG